MTLSFEPIIIEETHFKQQRNPTDMAVMDEFKEQRESLKNKPLRAKIAYFFDYYRWHVLGALAATLLLLWFAHDLLNARDLALYGVFLNASSSTLDSSDNFSRDFADYAGVDLNQYSLSFDHTFRMGQTMDSAGMESSQMLMVYLAAGDLDVITMDEYNFNKYSYKNVYCDLRTYFSEEELARYKDFIFYIDEPFLAEVERVTAEENLNYVIEYPDNADPDTMENPIPVGISLAASETFSAYYTYGDTSAFIGIVTNTKHPELCKQLFQFLFDL